MGGRGKEERKERGQKQGSRHPYTLTQTLINAHGERRATEDFVCLCALSSATLLPGRAALIQALMSAAK